METKDIVFTVMAGFLVLIVGVLIGLKLGFDCLEEPKKEKKKKTLESLHCFDCEIEMPVKEKNGRLFCSNCGLLH